MRGSQLTSPPRTEHISQRFMHPEKRYHSVNDRLATHTNCRGCTGVTHSTIMLANVASQEFRQRDIRVRDKYDQSLERATQLGLNLKVRYEAERDIAKAEKAAEEWEKRAWLQTVLEARSEKQSQRFHESRNAHAHVRSRSVDSVSQLRERNISDRRKAVRIAQTWKHVPISPSTGPAPYTFSPVKTCDPPRRSSMLTAREGGVGAVTVTSPHVIALLEQT